jgi:hypothetical protein
MKDSKSGEGSQADMESMHGHDDKNDGSVQRYDENNRNTQKHPSKSTSK